MEIKSELLNKETQTKLTPDQVYDALKQGNKRYITNQLT